MSAGQRRLLVIDPLSEDLGHLLEDDLFWSINLAPLVDQFEILSSARSIANIKRDAPETSTRVHRSAALFAWTGSLHLRYLARTSVFARKFDAALFQSFHELSALWFGILNPRIPVFLIVTNNLTGDNVNTSRRIRLRQMLFKRAVAIFVFSDYECRLIERLHPEIDLAKIHRLGYHKTGIQRSVVPLGKRRAEVAFMGKPTVERGIHVFLDWARLDTSSLRFVIYADKLSDSRLIESDVALKDKVEVVEGYLSDEAYHEVLASVAFVALPFHESLAGRFSGILADAISHGTPCIATPQSPFSELFTKSGPFGHLFAVDSYDGEAVRKSFESLEDWELFQRSMQRIRDDCSPSAIAAHVCEVIFGKT